MKKRMIAIVLAAVLLIGGAVTGTLAWLTAETQPVVNTFTYGDINIALDETKVTPDGTPVDADGDGAADKTTEGNTYNMIPGTTYLKDPTITIQAGSEACWLFVKLDESGGNITIGSTSYTFDDFLTYEMAEGWYVLDSTNNVYWRQVTKSEADVTIPVLKDNQIQVKQSITKDMLNALDADGTTNYPTLTVTGYAVQSAHIDSASAAWAIVCPDAETE